MVEGVCPLAVLIGRLGRRGTGLVGVLNEVPAAAEHEFGSPAVQCESSGPAVSACCVLLIVALALIPVAFLVSCYQFPVDRAGWRNWRCVGWVGSELGSWLLGLVCLGLIWSDLLLFYTGAGKQAFDGSHHGPRNKPAVVLLHRLGNTPGRMAHAGRGQGGTRFLLTWNSEPHLRSDFDFALPGVA